jgi:hypothetical protein
MKTRLRRLLLAALTGVGCAPDIPQPCLVGRADSSTYAAQATLKPGQAITPDCEALTPPSRIELYSVEKYNPPDAPSTVALRPLNLLRTDADGNPIVDGAHSSLAQGPFTSFNVDASGFCSVPVLSQAEQDFPDGSGGAEQVVYLFSDMRFLDTAAYQGTQMAASLHYTDGACSADYDVVAVWPTVGCTTTADCNPAQDISQGNFGSGINAAYPVSCDALAQLCVLSGTSFPQLSGFVP